MDMSVAQCRESEGTAKRVRLATLGNLSTILLRMKCENPKEIMWKLSNDYHKTNFCFEWDLIKIGAFDRTTQMASTRKRWCSTCFSEWIIIHLLSIWKRPTFFRFEWIRPSCGLGGWSKPNHIHFVGSVSAHYTHWPWCTHYMRNIIAAKRNTFFAIPIPAPPANECEHLLM